MTLDDKVRFTLRLNANIYKLICEESKRKGISKNVLITEILWNYFDKPA